MADTFGVSAWNDSPATRYPGSSTFGRLPYDLLVEILVLLGINDILSLRQVCKVFAQASRTRGLWVHLVHREVLSRKLPWPAHALPLTLAPTRTIEEYTLRLLSINRQWAPAMKFESREFSHCIFRPPNSIGWLRIVKGRWLILELRENRLEVWDLQDELPGEPVASYDGLKGTIDGSAIDASAGSSVVLDFSTSSYVATSLKIDLPYLGECRSIPSFVLLDSFEGYSGLLAAKAGLAVFSHSVSKKAPLVRDMHTGSIVFFEGSEATGRPEQRFSARILKEYIVIIGLYAMEAYSIARIRSLMTNGPQNASPNAVYPIQSLAYPGGEKAAHVEVLDFPAECANLSRVDTELQFCIGTHSTWQTRDGSVLTSSSSPTPVPPHSLLPRDTFSRRREFGRLPAAGVQAADGFFSLFGPEVIENSIPNEVLPQPDPLWPVLHPVPWPANVPDDPLSKPIFDTPMPWRAEVEHHFPMMNDPNCYGGARWFVNEALHIPGPASLVMFTLSALYQRACWSVRIIQAASGRLIAVEANLDNQSYSVKLLGSEVTLDQVPDLLSQPYPVEGVAGVNLEVDYAVVNRYAFWKSCAENIVYGSPSPIW
ncbi:hypothetical protein FRC01_007413 [Tulasnella sp. 417]|nr:hypothetical protein FRC01_007413 [Tulasnella sp. 417]